MAEIVNTNVFDSNKKFVDFGGLDYFWAKAKAYVDAADKDLSDRLDAAEAALEALGTGEGSVKSQIDNAIAALDLPNSYDSKGSAEAAQAAVQGNLDNHIADAVMHITADERAAWNAAKSDIDAFLKDAAFDAEGKNVIDTLKELQSYMESDEAAASQLVNRVGALEDAVEVINGEGDGSIKSAVAALKDGEVKANADAIAVINGDAEGSIKKAAADAKAEAIKAAEDAVAALKDGEVKANADAIAVINGEGDGSINKAAADAKAEAIADANAYTDALYNSIQFASEEDIDSLFAVKEEEEGK